MKNKKLNIFISNSSGFHLDGNIFGISFSFLLTRVIFFVAVAIFGTCENLVDKVCV